MHHGPPRSDAAEDRHFTVDSTALPDSTTVPPTTLGGAYAWYTLALLMLVYIVNVIDRNILSILAEDIKASLQLTDTDLGFLYGTSFAIFFSLFGIPFGRLADGWYRGRLIAIGLAFWSVMTSLSGLSRSYESLTFARIGVAIGESSATPAAWSLLADIFPRQRRALVNALYALAAIIGSSLSLPLGGWIAASWNRAYPGTGAPLGLAGWQAAFIAVGAPGLLLAILVFALREPVRGASDEAVGKDGANKSTAVVRPSAWRDFATELTRIVPPFTLWSAARLPGELAKNLILLAGVSATAWLLILATGNQAQWIAYGIGVYAIASWVRQLKFRDGETYDLIWGSPTVLMAIGGFGALAFLTISLLFWTAPYALRTFGLGKEEVGLLIGLPTAIAAGAGLLVGGTLSDFWRARDRRGRILVSMLSAVLPVPFLVGMMLAPDISTYAIFNFLTTFTVQLWGASAVSAMQEFVPARLRGTIMATHGLGATMLGSALGPYVSGKVATISGSLQLGIFSALCACPIALILLWLVCRRLKSQPVEGMAV